MNRLYGHWQTAAWAPPQATNGRVPKNERGQVDVPPFALTLPQGATDAVRCQCYLTPALSAVRADHVGLALMLEHFSLCVVSEQLHL